MLVKSGGNDVKLVEWDGASWSTLGSGVGGPVYAFVVNDDNLVVGGNFDTAGGEIAPYIACWTLKTSAVSEEASSLPSVLKIYPNYPNPFNPTTVIRFDMTQTLPVRVVMYNMVGQQVRVLHDGSLSMGSHSLVWDGRDGTGNAVASGTYFYVIKAGEYMAKGKVMYLR